MKARFNGGTNIAMKVPPHQHAATVHFYREVLGLTQLDESGDSVAFRFGPNRLWIDKVESVSQAEIWLEVVTDATGAAANTLADADVVRCDAIEALPKDLDGFWVSSPASIIHLVTADNGSTIEGSSR